MHYLDRTLPTIEANLALDEAILIAAEEGGPPVLRLWEPAEPAVILGASSRLAEDVIVAACQAEGVAIRRRSSGGGTVVIGPGSLNVTVVLPLNIAPGLEAVEAAQRFVLEQLAGSLREAGAPVEVRGSGDLTLGERKCAGSAQRRLRKHFLVHVTIMYAMPLELITRYTHLPARQPAYRNGRSHAEFLANLALPRDGLVRAVQAAWLPSREPPRPASVPEVLVENLVAEKFADRAWVERF